MVALSKQSLLDLAPLSYSGVPEVEEKDAGASATSRKVLEDSGGCTDWSQGAMRRWSLCDGGRWAM